MKNSPRNRGRKSTTRGNNPIIWSRSWVFFFFFNGSHSLCVCVCVRAPSEIKKENPEFNSPERLFLLVTDFGGKREKEKWKEAIGLANIDFLYFSWHKWSETASTNLFFCLLLSLLYQRFQYRNLNPRLYNTISACVHISSLIYFVSFLLI